jgi:hypothetical protein
VAPVTRLRPSSKGRGVGSSSQMATKNKKRPKYTASYRIGDPDCPPEFSDAGRAEAFMRSERIKRISRYRIAARRAFDNAQRTYRHARTQAEKYAREALDLGAKAYWLAEYTEFAEREHRRLYKMGSWVRRTFGCELNYVDGKYTQRCPVAIASKRLGFSPGFTAIRWCSICDHDLSECPHMRDRMYWVRGGPRGSLRCSVCVNDDDSCNHSPNRLYRVPVVSIIKEVDELREVSIVTNPAQPFARLIEIPISMKELGKQLGPEFISGIPVSCDSCLRAYPGLPPQLEFGSGNPSE